MIKNSSGQVAMRWVLNRMPQRVRVGEHEYLPSSQRNVHLLWVEESDVPALLNHKMKTCNCNNGTKVNAFILASRLDVGVHETGDRHYFNPEYTEIA